MKTNKLEFTLFLIFSSFFLSLVYYVGLIQKTPEHTSYNILLLISLMVFIGPFRSTLYGYETSFNNLIQDKRVITILILGTLLFLSVLIMFLISFFTANFNSDYGYTLLAFTIVPYLLYLKISSLSFNLSSDRLRYSIIPAVIIIFIIIFYAFLDKEFSKDIISSWQSGGLELIWVPFEFISLVASFIFFLLVTIISLYLLNPFFIGYTLTKIPVTIISFPVIISVSPLLLFFYPGLGHYVTVYLSMFIEDSIYNFSDTATVIFFLSIYLLTSIISVFFVFKIIVSYFIKNSIISGIFTIILVTIFYSGLTYNKYIDNSLKELATNIKADKRAVYTYLCETRKTYLMKKRATASFNYGGYEQSVFELKKLRDNYSMCAKEKSK